MNRISSASTTHQTLLTLHNLSPARYHLPWALGGHSPQPFNLSVLAKLQAACSICNIDWQRQQQQFMANNQRTQLSVPVTSLYALCLSGRVLLVPKVDLRSRLETCSEISLLIYVCQRLTPPLEFVTCCWTLVAGRPLQQTASATVTVQPDATADTLTHTALRTQAHFPSFCYITILRDQACKPFDIHAERKLIASSFTLGDERKPFDS